MTSDPTGQQTFFKLSNCLESRHPGHPAPCLQHLLAAMFRTLIQIHRFSSWDFCFIFLRRILWGFSFNCYFLCDLHENALVQKLHDLLVVFPFNLLCPQVVPQKMNGDFYQPYCFYVVPSTRYEPGTIQRTPSDSGNGERCQTEGQNRPWDTYLVFTLAEQLLFAHIVNPQQFSDSDQHSPLKRSDSKRNILYRGLPRKTHKK